MNRRDFLAAAAAPLVLGLPAPAFGGRAGGTPVALVTADLESNVVAVQLPTGGVVRRLETSPGPRSIESVGGTGALVAHTEHGLLTVVDSRLRVHEVHGALGAPRYTAVSPDRRLAYVSDSERQEI
ncbi:MAG: hypothetical protein ACJ744_05385, partial [Gaiellaceae bacterium]